VSYIIRPEYTHTEIGVSVFHTDDIIYCVYCGEYSMALFTAIPAGVLYIRVCVCVCVLANDSSSTQAVITITYIIIRKTALARVRDISRDKSRLFTQTSIPPSIQGCEN